MWGTRISEEPEGHGVRFIPTHVGNSCASGSIRQDRPVHPHTCGELGGLHEGDGTDDGSSPHLWGTHLKGARALDLLRFIPTHVGNSLDCRMCRNLRPVHPHTCGELGTTTLYAVWSLGSSPHMWGTPYMPLSSSDVDRFIPTHVGNSSTMALATHLIPVHPHTCGELILMPWRRISRIGSSPHMWGTQIYGFARNHERRFIPTHVGNSVHRTATPSTLSVHPHTCGELSLIILIVLWSTVHPHTCGELVEPLAVPSLWIGSSPHMWGTHHGTETTYTLSRFIPTHVGNSHCVPVELEIRTVHPHTCGELRVIARYTTGLWGSSPHMWGTLS